MKKLVVVAIAAVMLTLGGIAYAAIPSADGVIHGCRKLNNPAKGSVVVVDAEASESCPSGFAALDWNQTGPQGPAGPVGPQGPAGEGLPAFYTRDFTQGPIDVADGDAISRTAWCFSGDRLISGGFEQQGTMFHVREDSADFSNPSNPLWFVVTQNQTGSTASATLRVRIVCADTSPD